MREIWKTYKNWLLWGIIFYLLFSLIAVNINFLEWHWLGRTVYIAGGTSAFILAYLSGVDDKP